MDTSENNPITAVEICKRLKAYGIEAERKSVCRDINTLIDSGYDILLCEDNKRGYYMASREFEDWELKVLIDALWQAKFLPYQDTKSITDRIYKLASSESRRMLNSVTPVRSYVKSNNMWIKINIDTLLHAIRQEKKVCFKYTYTDTDKNKKLRRDGGLYVVNPYSLVWQNEHYYLIGNYDEYDNLSYYRLDRIKEIQISNEPIKPADVILGKNADTKIEAYVVQSIYQYGGEKIHLVIEVHEYMADTLIDYFGKDITFNKSGNDLYRVSVQVFNGEGLYFWLLQHGEHIRVIEPESVRYKLLEKIKVIADAYAH